MNLPQHTTILFHCLLIVLHHQLQELLKTHSRLQCTLSPELTLQTVTRLPEWTDLSSSLWTKGGRVGHKGSLLLTTWLLCSVLMFLFHKKFSLHQPLWCHPVLQLLYQMVTLGCPIQMFSPDLISQVHTFYLVWTYHHNCLWIVDGGFMMFPWCKTTQLHQIVFQPTAPFRLCQEFMIILSHFPWALPQELTPGTLAWHLVWTYHYSYLWATGGRVR